MATAELTLQAQQMLASLARSPRFAGSEAEARARVTAREDLQRSGLACEEIGFDYSAWPGKWGPPAAAAAQLMTVLLVARTARGGEPALAVGLGVAVLVLLAIVSRDARRRWTSVFPMMRSRSANLQASRGQPTLWLAAHIDSKSQTVPMLFRIVASALLSALTFVTLAAAVLQTVGVEGVRSYWLVMSLAAGIAALPSLLCVVRNDSTGAADNASGVAAVLLAVRQLPRDKAVGVLITSAEELGLAGARDWAARARADTRVVNCDTIDDGGIWLCMHTGRKPALSSLVETTARRSGFNLLTRRLIPGILADSVAFADRGIQAVTISRGSLATLARIHTRGDTSSALTGSGIADASVLLAALIMELG
ncbi:MAG TPA: M28 family peptidase [Gemmatimonadaceae bacterium]|nr:M28 family peptidase [Gemmatimonadaceae bacterium]